MDKIMKSLGFPLKDFEVVCEYLNQFRDCKVIFEDIERDNGEVKVLCNDELITVIFIEISFGKWWSIYRYHSDETKYEQIDIIIFDEIRNSKYNQVIKYSGHIEDDKYSYIICSGHSYLNGQFSSSWQESRIVPIDELSKIQYSKNMNLTELICMTDKNSNNIIKKKELKDVKSLVLKLDKSINI